MQGPFRYRALQPTDISFVPLTESGDKSYNGSELLNFYREDPTVKHLKVLPQKTIYIYIYIYIFI